MKGRQIRYSEEELAWLEMLSPLPRRQLHQKFQKAFARTDVTLEQIKALCTRRGWGTGRTGQFPKGATPANKGKKMPFNANSAATRFKKGHRNGVAVKLYKPIGSERFSKEGYLERKVHDGMPLQSRWRAVHTINWEALHGSIPDGHCLKCLDGNRLNTDPSNWELISRAELARLNGGRYKQYLAFDAAPAELKPTLLAVAKLDHRARTIRRGAERSGSGAQPNG